MKRIELYSKLVSAIVAIALLCTLLMDNGWLIWIPVLPALWVSQAVRRTFHH